ncbi:MAG: hypothetical protein IIC94_07275 [Chloroflexi bacterium]|nr:hypothetical protein [Chloroflexota bacterium]
MNDSTWDWNGIGLLWNDPAFDVDSWVIERADAEEGPWLVLAAVAPRDLDVESSPGRYWDNGLVPGRAYHYRLSGCTDDGRTNPTNVASGVAPQFMPGLAPPIATPAPVEAPC